MHLRVSPDPISLHHENERITQQLKNSGGLVTFSGLVRPTSATGDITGLRLEAYSPMTERGIEAAMQDAIDRWNLETVSVVHRVGDMRPGDIIVFVGTAAAHRRAAFEAADYLMDYLKTEAIFWKQESSGSTRKWIEPRECDYADRQRWNTES